MTFFAGCKASLYRKTTWQAFIFHQKKSFKQHMSEIRGGRSNCLVSWRGMTQLDAKIPKQIVNIIQFD